MIQDTFDDNLFLSNVFVIRHPGHPDQSVHGKWAGKSVVKKGKPLSLKNGSVKAGMKVATKMLAGGSLDKGAVELKKDFGIKKGKVGLSIGGKMVKVDAMVHGDIAAHPSRADGTGPIVLTHIKSGRRLPLIPDSREPAKVYKALIVANKAGNWDFDDPMGKDRVKAQTAINRLAGVKHVFDSPSRGAGEQITFPSGSTGTTYGSPREYSSGMDKYDNKFTGDSAWRAIEDPANDDGWTDELDF